MVVIIGSDGWCLQQTSLDGDGDATFIVDQTAIHRSIHVYVTGNADLLVPELFLEVSLPWLYTFFSRLPLVEKNSLLAVQPSQFTLV